MSQTVKEIGEHGLLRLLQPFCSNRVGDDAAAMGATLPDHEMVVTTDVLIENVHFSALTTSAEDIGWRAAAVNLSDIAAMGAKPWGAVIAVGLPPHSHVDWITDVYCGLTNCLKTYGAELVGGDTVRSPVVSLAVTIFGQVRSPQIIQRHTAQVDDAILITGAHGLSKAGLELLLHPELQQRAHEVLSSQEISALYQAHQHPVPRLDVPPLVWQIYEDLPIETRRLTGMDSSDGLADAIIQICRASNVGASLDWSAFPIHTSIQAIAGEQALNWVLYGGEDFELVLCLPLEVAQIVTQELDSALIIGKIIKDNTINGLDIQESFQHF